MRLVAALITIFLLTAPAPAAWAEEILVFAAASTIDALREIGPEFQRETGNHVSFSFAASSTLARQIIAGAPADVFLSADSAKMNEVEKAGLVRRQDVHNLLSNQLVVVVRSDSAIHLSSPSELKSLSTIATGDPKAVPVGVYAKKWLTSKGLWNAVGPKIVPALDVRAALAAVETGAAQAAIVYRTDAAISSKVRVAYAVPRQEGPEIIYPVAPVDTSSKSAAKAFVDFLLASRARAVFQRFGFIVL